MFPVKEFGGANPDNEPAVGVPPRISTYLLRPFRIAGDPIGVGVGTRELE